MELSLLDGVLVSIFSMLIVFFILLLLALLISGFRWITPKTKPEPVAAPAAPAATSDEEERWVAQLTAACLAKEDFSGDVRIVECKRVR